MRILKVLELTTIVLMVNVCISAFAGTDVPEIASKDYIIGPGDVLEISVWKEDALSKNITVLPDGKINYPLIGEVQAAGRTVAQRPAAICACGPERRAKTWDHQQTRVQPTP